MVIVMPLGPLLFFYTKASLNSEYKLTRKEKRHFITVIIDLFPYLTAILFIAAYYSGYLKVGPAPKRHGHGNLPGLVWSRTF